MSSKVVKKYVVALSAMAMLVGGMSAWGDATWQNSNVTNTPTSTLDWFSGGPNTQAVWAPTGNPVSDSTTVIQVFQDTTTALLNTNTVVGSQTANINNNGAAFELGGLSLEGKASATANANLTMTLSGDALNFSGTTGTISLDGVNNTRVLTYNLDSPIQLGTASSTGALAITGNGTGTFNIGGGISELQAGGGSVTKSGTSTLTLSGVNSYTGGTVINEGMLQFNSGAAPASGLIAINSAGTLPATGAYSSAGDWLASGKIAAASSGLLVLTANNGADVDLTGYDNLYLGATGGYTFGNYALTPGANGYLLGGGGGTLTLNGGHCLVAGHNLTVGGNLYLDTYNSGFNGAITVNAGTLSWDHLSALGSPSSITLAGGTALQPEVNLMVINAPITLGASGTTSKINLPEINPSTLTLNGAISGDGNLTLNYEPGSSSKGYINLGGQSTYGGSTLLTKTHDGGTLTVNLTVANALPVTTVLTLDGLEGVGSGRTLTLDLNGHDQTLAGLKNVNRKYRNQRVHNSGALATLTVNNSDDYSYGYVYVGSRGTTTTTIAGAITLTKQGAGILTLTGPNTYTGGTIITAGTLSISIAYLADDADVSVASGAIFNLNFTGTDTIGALFLDGVQMAGGTWGTTASGATNTDNVHFTGNGKLLVTVTPTPLGTVISIR